MSLRNFKYFENCYDSLKNMKISAFVNSIFHKEVNFQSLRNFKYFEGSYDSLKNIEFSAFGISIFSQRS